MKRFTGLVALTLIIQACGGPRKAPVPPAPKPPPAPVVIPQEIPDLTGFWKERRPWSNIWWIEKDGSQFRGYRVDVHTGHSFLNALARPDPGNKPGMRIKPGDQGGFTGQVILWARKHNWRCLSGRARLLNAAINFEYKVSRNPARPGWLKGRAQARTRTGRYCLEVWRREAFFLTRLSEKESQRYILPVYRRITKEQVPSLALIKERIWNIREKSGTSGAASTIAGIIERVERKMEARGRSWQTDEALRLAAAEIRSRIPKKSRERWQWLLDLLPGKGQS